MEHKWASLASCLVVLFTAISLVPKIGTHFFTVNLFLPEETPIRQTKAEAVKSIEAIDRLDGPEIEAYTTFVEAGTPGSGSWSSSGSGPTSGAGWKT